MGSYLFTSKEERRRLLELIAIVVTVLVLVLISQLEVRLYELSSLLSSNQEFFQTIVYFALINLNVILVLLLSFLIFRNIAKIVVQRRRGVFGSRLRTKLIVSLVLFALAPTALMFYISTRFMTTSFESWFSEKVRHTMQQTREAGARVYRQDQHRLESLARIALTKVKVDGPVEIYSSLSETIDASLLRGFVKEYGLHAIKVFDRYGILNWAYHKVYESNLEKMESIAHPSVLNALDLFISEPELNSVGGVEEQGGQDVVIGVAPIVSFSGRILGVVVAEEQFETQILKSIEAILADFGSLRPGAQLIRLSFTILMIVMSLLILFSASWLGFYVARDITGPIQRLAEATREVAAGNYGITLDWNKSDETGQLVKAFNQMTHDLASHKAQVESSQNELRRANVASEQRRLFMETVLQNMTSGVISLDASHRVVTVNQAAERLLEIHEDQLVGATLEKGLSPELKKHFWEPLLQGGIEKGNLKTQIDLQPMGREVTLMVQVLRIFSDQSKTAAWHSMQTEEVATVIVFDDEKELVMAQRVAAWREVARRIAHEIKNPITPVKLSAQRLLRRYHERFTGDDKEVFESCVETILMQVDCLRDLVNEFTKFSRLPAVMPQPGRIVEVVEDVFTLYRMSYPRVHFEVICVNDVPELLIDKEQMNRVFMNLTTNSLAALDEESGNGHLRVEIKYINELQMVRLSVCDNGKGIPVPLRNRVLEPYFSTKDEGTGLGLAIVNQVISDHGGYVRIQGNLPRGTMIIIELPVTRKI